MLYRLLALFVLCVGLAGCDSGGPAEELPPNAIIGTWALQSATLDTYATVSQTQTALDLFTPAEGVIAVEGALTASIRYLDQRYSNSWGDGTLTGYSLSSVPESAMSSASVRFAVTPSGSAVLSVQREDGGEAQAFYVDDPWDPNLFSLGPDTIRVSRARYSAWPRGSGETVFVEGVLVLSRRTIEAGRETLLSRRAQSSYVAEGRSWTFHADGTYEERSIFGSRTGNWEATRDGVSVEVSGASLLFRSEVDGPSLTLTSASNLCSYLCEFDMRRYYDLIEGTVEAGRIENVLSFVRSVP